MITLEFQLSQNINLEMVEIPAGSFLMGSSEDENIFRENETPQHKVEIRSFFIGKVPVTQAQWFAVMNEMPKIAEDFRGDNFPVVNVWLEKALEFCAKISKLMGKNFRLPSEAKWEYVCRAGTLTPYFFGEKLTANSANFDGENLTAVGTFPPNDFGAYDMHGNVWEWCADVWHENYLGAPTDGSAWNVPADRCRSAFRVGDIARNADQIVGLRVCMDK